MELRGRLQRLAELTGGQAFFPLSMKDLDAAYGKVAAEIDAQYSMGYVSTNANAGRHVAEGRDQGRPGRA